MLPDTRTNRFKLRAFDDITPYPYPERFTFYLSTQFSFYFPVTIDPRFIEEYRPTEQINFSQIASYPKCYESSYTVGNDTYTVTIELNYSEITVTFYINGTQISTGYLYDTKPLDNVEPDRLYYVDYN